MGASVPTSLLLLWWYWGIEEWAGHRAAPRLIDREKSLNLLQWWCNTIIKLCNKEKEMSGMAASWHNSVKLPLKVFLRENCDDIHLYDKVVTGSSVNLRSCRVWQWTFSLRTVTDRSGTSWWEHTVSCITKLVQRTFSLLLFLYPVLFSLNLSSDPVCSVGA